MGSVLTLNGAIKDGMAGDIVTNVQKNMNGWVASGTGTVTLTYADGVNTLEFANGGESGAKSKFIEDYKQIYNVTMPSAWADYFLTIWKNKGVSGVWENCPYLYTYSEGGSYKNFMQVNSDSRLNSSNALQIYQGDKVNSVGNSQFSQNTVSTYYSNSSATFTMQNGGGNINHAWGTYEDWLNPISKKYDLTLATEANKKYILTFGAKTSTGFTTGADAIKITNGTTTGTISIDGTSSNDFTEYKILFTAETTSVTIELDLSAIQSSSDIELDIKNVSLYEIGVSGGGGGSDYEVVTEDFSFQCTSAYPETHEGATASRVVSVDNSNGYTYLQFTWSNNGAATGYGWVQGQYTFNGVTTQLYFQQNSISEIGDTVKLGIVGMGTTFDVTFIVNATTNYQYSSSTAVLNITDVILTNE